MTKNLVNLNLVFSEVHQDAFCAPPAPPDVVQDFFFLLDPMTANPRPLQNYSYSRSSFGKTLPTPIFTCPMKFTIFATNDIFHNHNVFKRGVDTSSVQS